MEIIDDKGDESGAIPLDQDVALFEPGTKDSFTRTTTTITGDPVGLRIWHNGGGKGVP